jgi:hypothetical protein
MAKPDMPVRRPKDEPDEEALRGALGLPATPTPGPAPSPAPAEAAPQVPPPAPTPAPAFMPPVTGKETVSVRMSTKSRDIYRKVGAELGWTPNQIMGAVADNQALILDEIFEREGVVGVLNLLVRK